MDYTVPTSCWNIILKVLSPRYYRAEYGVVWVLYLEPEGILISNGRVFLVAANAAPDRESEDDGSEFRIFALKSTERHESDARRS